MNALMNAHAGGRLMAIMFETPPEFGFPGSWFVNS